MITVGYETQLVLLSKATPLSWGSSPVTVDGLALRHATVIDDAWSTLIEVYADVRADQLHLPHYSIERFGEQLARHGSDPGWEAVIGYDARVPVGFAYANRLTPNGELLRDRPEEQVSLLANALNGDGKVKALYKSWGYKPISTQQPSADGPILTAMLRPTRPGPRSTS